jgi:sRNA-binding regulator protein Hfq
MMIYKHAISTVTPGKPILFTGQLEDDNTTVE